MTREEKMTPEEAIAEISYLKVAVNKVVEQALDMAIQALSQEPFECDDAVSRMALGRSKMCDGIDCYNCPFWVIREGQRICRISEYVKDLPSVTQKSGK